MDVLRGRRRGRRRDDAARDRRSLGPTPGEIATLGAVAIPILVGAVVVQAVRDTRRARERRAQRSAPQ